MFSFNFSFLVYAFIAIFLVLAVLMCYQESKRRQINFYVALLLSLVLTPIISYIIILNRPLREARACENCGNTKNETDVCGVCGNQVKRKDSSVDGHLVE